MKPTSQGERVAYISLWTRALITLVAGCLWLSSGGAGAAPFLYVGNYTGEVHIVDTATNSVVGTIPNANGSGLVINPDGSRVYVDVGTTVNVYDTSSYALLATIPGPADGGMAINSTGNKLYIASYSNSFVRVVDTSTYADVATVPSPQATVVTVSPDGTRVYVTDQNTRVYVIDATTNTPLTSVTVGNFVTGLTVHPSGAFLYAANTNDNTVSVVDTQTNSVVATVPVGPPGCCYNGPTSLAVHPSGTFLYAVTADMTLRVIRTSDNVLVASIPTTPNPPGADGTTFLKTSPDGSTLYFSKYSGGTVTAVATSTNTVTATIAIPGAPGMLTMAPTLPVTYTFSGTIQNNGGTGLNVGEKIKGTFVVNSANGSSNGGATFYNLLSATVTLPQGMGTLGWDGQSGSASVVNDSQGVDQFNLNAGLGLGNLVSIVTQDDQGTVFSDESLPLVVPLPGFEVRRLELSFSSAGPWGDCSFPNFPGGCQILASLDSLVGPNPDADGDGVNDAIDTGAASFADFGSPPTIGNIINANGLSVTVEDSPDPSEGVVIIVGPGVGAARLSVCGFSLQLFAGSSIVATCGSITIKVNEGLARVSLNATDTSYVDIADAAVAKVAQETNGTFAIQNLGETAITVTTDDVTTLVQAGEHVSAGTLFTGFYSPVEMNNVQNRVKAGSTVPLKWRLTNAIDGSPVTNLSSASVIATNFTCGLGVTVDLVEEASAGATGLQNLGDGYYQFNWKTPKTYANSCKTLTLTLGGGIPNQSAYFSFVQ